MPKLDRHRAFELNLDINAHLRKYIEEWTGRGFERPGYFIELEPAMKALEEFNIIYPVQPPAFIHAIKPGTGGSKYVIIEPEMSDELKSKYEIIAKAFQAECADIVKKTPAVERGRTAVEFVERMTGAPKRPGGRLAGLFGSGRPPAVRVCPDERLAITLRLVRDIKDHGALTPIIDDPYVDEMVSVGAGRLDVVHKIWGTMETSLKFDDARALDALFEKEALHPGRGWEDQKTIAFRTSLDTTGMIQR